MKDIYCEIELQFARSIDYLVSASNADTLAKLGELHVQMLKALTAQMEQQYADFAKETSSLTSACVHLEIQDRDTKRVYRRELPMDYEENSNGITLKGETLTGKPTSISFLSNTALEKITELTGHGVNNPLCNHDHTI